MSSYTNYAGLIVQIGSFVLACLSVYCILLQFNYRVYNLFYDTMDVMLGQSHNILLEILDCFIFARLMTRCAKVFRVYSETGGRGLLYVYIVWVTMLMLSVSKRGPQPPTKINKGR